jgi:hypothetical protein
MPTLKYKPDGIVWRKRTRNVAIAGTLEMLASSVVAAKVAMIPVLRYTSKTILMM